MRKLTFRATMAALALGTCFTATQGAAQNITGPTQITGATSSVANGNGTFPLQQIRDGNTSELNGFQGANNGTGSIEFELDKTYTINQFFLWNDINVRAEGIERFTLTFLNSAGGTISTTPPLTAKPGRTPGQAVNLSSFSKINPVQIFDFPAVSGVKKVRLNVVSLLGQDNTFARRIEIREVAFNGPAGAKGMDSFRCYDLMRHSTQPEQKRINMVDQFGRTRTLLGHPVQLCNPVAMDDRSATPEQMHKEYKDHLVCYEMFDIAGDNQSVIPVQVRNKVETNNLAVGHADQICLVSDKKRTA